MKIWIISSSGSTPAAIEDAREVFMAEDTARMAADEEDTYVHELEVVSVYEKIMNPTYHKVG